MGYLITSGSLGCFLSSMVVYALLLKMSKLFIIYCSWFTPAGDTWLSISASSRNLISSGFTWLFITVAFGLACKFLILSISYCHLFWTWWSCGSLWDWGDRSSGWGAFTWCSLLMAPPIRIFCIISRSFSHWVLASRDTSIGLGPMLTGGIEDIGTSPYISYMIFSFSI